MKKQQQQQLGGGEGMESPSSQPPRGGGQVVAKVAQYVGSFAVEDAELQQKVQAVHQQLQRLKDCPRRRVVVLHFSLRGLKMYGAEREVLLMAHALRRILYSTCRPAERQFAFVARNPRDPRHQLFCHLFAGSQPSEVQGLHFLLCRSFQLCYLQRHPEQQDWPSPGQSPPEAGRTPPDDSHGAWESLRPEEISQNVNALVSFQRLPCPADFGASVSVSERLDLEERGHRVGGPSRPGNPYCSPTLVRKKAIRSKILRSGAYRGCTFDVQSQPCTQEILHPSGEGDKGGGSGPVYLSENEGSLMESVWSFAGIDRDAGMALLRKDVLGAFLLWAQPGRPDRWCLTVRTRCGVIPYQIYRSQVGRFSVEPLNEEFPTLEALLDHYSGTQGGLFCSLASGRLNHGYEEQDSAAAAAGEGRREDRSRRKAAWLHGGSKSLAVLQELG